VIVVCALAMTREENQFRDWMSQYGRKYSIGSTEYSQRFANFKATLVRIARHNRQSKHATFGLNKFADLSETEFARTRKMPKVGAQGFATACLATGTAAPMDEDASALPDAFDWRDKGAVTPVKDQGVCGSCWAFSATGNIEGQYFLKSGKLVSFSEQLLVDCSQGCSNIPGEGQACDEGCNGGFQWNAFYDLINWGGIETEDSYPYTSGDTGQGGTCQKNNALLMASFNNYTCLSGVTNGAPADEEQMAEYMMKNGPLAIALNAGYLQSYTGGIIDPWVPRFECDPTALDHGVLIVGWGVENGELGQTPYWIVKNSWAWNWGENGYFRIYRGSNVCGVAMAVSSVNY